MLELLGKSDIQHSDVFSVNCRKCGVETMNEFLRVPVVLLFKATCEKCGESSVFRLNKTQWIGRPIA